MGEGGQRLPLVLPEANVIEKASQAVSSLCPHIRPLGFLCNWSRGDKDHRHSDQPTQANQDVGPSGLNL